MRLTVTALISLTILLAGCSEGTEPMTHPEDIPRLRTGRAPSEPARTVVEPAGRREPPPAPRPAVAEPTPPAQDVVEGDQRSPDEWVARLVTDVGNIDIEVHRDWAPHGADRFYTLVREGFFDDVAFFRVIEGFMAQGGIHGDPEVAARWRNRRIPDDPNAGHSNSRGMVTFAKGGPNTRTTQFFINLVDNARLDAMGFPPFGQVRDASMANVGRIHSGYGESQPRGQGPVQGRLQAEGNAYLRADFPNLTYIRSASVLEGGE